MSAIYGIWRFDDARVNESDISRMGATMAHRTSDGRDHFIDGSIGLGHGLLLETREDAFDAQPLYDRDAALVLVADARIDNREALAALLAIDTATLATLPDSALILQAYRQWGEACAERLLGDFAFAIWDVRARKLVLGRDHMGQRYVHYHQGDGFFAFATEPKALLSLADVPRTLDEGTIARLLCMDFTPAGGATIFDGIKGIAGGTTLTITADGGVTTRRYWALAPDPAHLDQTEDYYVRTYRNLLAEAVACRVRRAIAPPGLLLSGGFDSSAIAGLSGPALPAGMKLVTVTSAGALGSDNPHDGRPKAEACLEIMPHLDHHWFGLANEPSFDLQTLGRSGDRPGGIFDALYQIFAAQGCRVIMDGFGGDQTINPRRNRALAALLARGRIGRFAHELLATARQEKVSKRSLLIKVRRQIVPRSLRRLWRLLRNGPATRDPGFYVAPTLAKRMVAEGKLWRPNLLSLYERNDEGALDRIVLDASQHWPCPNQTIEAATAGLLLTRPMLDKRIVEFGLAIPEHFHFRNGRQRHLARLALRDVLPAMLRTGPMGQEYFDPNFRTTVEGMIGAISESIAALDNNSSLRAYIALDVLQKNSAAGQLLGEQPGRYVRLINTLQIARYIDWLDRQNR
ncbi:MAG: hypothetical protein K2X59_03910 [Sphingomonas sp.]|nr:hypothetical protein [Sphingomonas sp.]